MKTILLACLLFAIPAYAQDDLPMPVNAAHYERAELEQMLAPIALYPDAVLSNVLVAATYPLEVVQAARWSEANPGLEGEAAVEAVEDQDWDPSVKALVAFPELLARMNGDLGWMQRLGDAMLAQEDEVMVAVQSLRERAYAANTLDQVQHIVVRRVVHEERPAERIIVIEPADPQIVYVPVYQPTVVYGGWHWPHHRPHVWHLPHHHHYTAGFWWGSGIRYSQSYWFGAFDWHSHAIIVNVNHYHYRPRHPGVRRGFRPPEPPGVWRHNPRHRRGVPYRSVRMPVASPGELHPHPRPTVRTVRARFADAPQQVRTTPQVMPRVRTSPSTGNPKIRVMDDRLQKPVVGRTEPLGSTPRVRAAPTPVESRAAVTPMPRVRQAPRPFASDLPTVDRGRAAGVAPARVAPPRTASPSPRMRTPAPARAVRAAPVAAAPAPNPQQAAPKRATPEPRTRGASEQER